MTVNFYNSTENKNKINKTLINPTVKNLTLRNNFNVERPIIYLSFNPIENNLNYIEFVEMQKFYFIESVDLIRKNYYQVNLKLDVLKTYANNIKELTGTIIKSENPDNKNIDCEISSDFNLTEININDVFNHNGKIYLTTVFKGE